MHTILGRGSHGSMTPSNEEEEDEEKEKNRGRRKRRRRRRKEERRRAPQASPIAFPRPTRQAELRALTGSRVGARRFCSSHASSNLWVMCLKTSVGGGGASFPGQHSHTTHLTRALVSWTTRDYYKSVLSPWRDSSENTCPPVHSCATLSLDIATSCEWTGYGVDQTLRSKRTVFSSYWVANSGRGTRKLCDHVKLQTPSLPVAVADKQVL